MYISHSDVGEMLDHVFPYVLGYPQNHRVLLKNEPTIVTY